MDPNPEPLRDYLREPNRERFELVVRTYYPLVWDISFRLTRHAEDAADVCQDFFLGLIVKPPPMDRIRSERGFLAYSVLSLVGHMRRAARRRLKREEESARLSIREGLPADDWRDVTDAVAALPEEFRVPVELRYIAGLKSREIGAVLAISEQAVTRRIREGRRMLRSRLAPLSIGSALAALRLEGAQAPPPPQDLLEGLIRIGELGGALAQPAAAAGSIGTIGTIGIIMTMKKIGIAAGIAALIVCGLFLLEWKFNFMKGAPEHAGRPAGVEAPSVAAGPAKEAGRADGKADLEKPAVDPAVPVPEIPVSLEGKVTDPQGLGIPGARVLALDTRAWEEGMKEGQQTLNQSPLLGVRFLRDLFEERMKLVPATETDSEGRYAFRGLSPAEYRVFITHPRYLPSSDSWALVVAGAAARCDVRLAPGQSLGGRVVDEKGAPVPGALVRAQGSENRRVKGVGKMVQALLDITEASMLLDSPAATKGDGSFTLGALEPVLHDIEARKDGYVPGEALGVLPGKDGIVVVLPRGAFIDGRVLGPQGKPLADAEVVLEEPGIDVSSGNPAVFMREMDILGEKRRAGKAGDDGRFRLEGVVPGTYELRASAEGCLPRIVKTEIAGEGIEVGDMTLEAALSISGIVLDPAGNPAGGVKVRLGDTEPHVIRIQAVEDGVAKAETDSRGRFRLDGVGAGPHEVRASSEVHGEAIQPNVEGGRKDLVLRLCGTLAIQGKVLDSEDGAPVSGADVILAASGRRSSSTEDGSFETKVPIEPGHASGAQKVHIQVTNEEYESFSGEVSPADGPTEIRLKRSPGIRGIVVDAGGQPVEGAKVRIEIPGIPEGLLALQAPRKAWSTFTEPDGTFAFKGTPPQMGTGIDLVAARAGIGRARFIIADAASADEIKLVLAPGSAIEGRVILGDGSSVAGAVVRLTLRIDLSGEMQSLHSMLPPMRGRIAYSDKVGGYRIADIEAGSYRLEVLAVGYAKKAIEPVEVGGTDLRMDVTLDAGGSIAGRVVDAAGDPLAGIEVVVFPEDEESDAGPGKPRDPRREVEQMFKKMGGMGIATARSGEDGAFEIKNLPDGVYRIVARAPGHALAESGPVRPGDKLEDLVLVAHARIVGRVTAANGAAVGDFTVSLELKDGDRKGRPWGIRRFTNPDGKFAAEDLEPGEYRVLILPSAHPPFETRIKAEPGSEAVVQAILEEGVTVEGFVRSAEDGTPIQGAQVAMRRPGMIRKSVMTSENGSFAIEGLPKGEITLDECSHPDYFWEEEILVFTVPFQEQPDLVIRLGRAGKVSGKIEGLPPFKSGEIMCTITLVRLEGGEPPPAKAGKRRPSTSHGVNPQGEFEIAGLRPGTYRLGLVDFRAEGRFQNPSSSKRTLGEVEVKAGETAIFKASVQ